MRAGERRLEILSYLHEHGYADNTVLADLFGVSTMTIRRDLAKLKQEGSIITEYGGAMLIEGTTYEHDMLVKQTERQEEKRRIAQHCTTYVRSGATVYLDSGSTVYELAHLLAARNDITVMTHSLLVANALANSNVDLIMCPGKYRPRSMAFMGQLTDRFVSDFRFDIMFLAVEGVDIKHGVSVPDIPDGATKTALIASSNWVCCMADSSKFDKRFHCSITPLSGIDVLVTDTGLSSSQFGRFSKAIELVCV